MGETCSTASLRYQGFHSLNSRKSPYKGPFILKDNQTFLLKELIIFDSFLFSKTREIFDRIQSPQSKSPFILAIKEYFLEDKEFYCQSSCHIAILLENYQRDLESEIQIRFKSDKVFSDQEIFGIFYCVLKGLEHLHTQIKNYFHGFLNLNTVVLSDDGKIKLMEGRVINPSSEGNIQQDLKDLGLMMIRTINLDPMYELSGGVKGLKNEKFRGMIEELVKGEKTIREYITLLKKIQSGSKCKENKENTPRIEENYLSFGNKSNMFAQSIHNSSKDNPEVLERIITENLTFSRSSLKASAKDKVKSLMTDSTEIMSTQPPLPLPKKQKITYEDGSYYEGELWNDLRHGRGTFVFSKGGFYKGEWNKGKMEGFGVLYYSSGRIAYEGEWRDDAFEGRGTIFSEEVEKVPDKEVNFREFQCRENMNLWESYTGDFRKDLKNGVGTLRFRTGERIVGSFTDDKANGICAFYRKDGSLIKGFWREDVLIEEID